MVPSRVDADQFDGSFGPDRRGIETELPELWQRKRRGCPRLADVLPFVKVEIAGKKGAAAHCPSASSYERRLAPQPLVSTLARSAVHSDSGASSRSRITCQRIDGPEPRSQSITGPESVTGRGHQLHVALVTSRGLVPGAEKPRARRVPDRAANHRQPRSLTARSQLGSPGPTLATTHAGTAFKLVMRVRSGSRVPRPCRFLRWRRSAMASPAWTRHPLTREPQIRGRWRGPGTSIR